MKSVNSSSTLFITMHNEMFPLLHIFIHSPSIILNVVLEVWKEPFVFSLLQQTNTVKFNICQMTCLLPRLVMFTGLKADFVSP